MEIFNLDFEGEKKYEPEAYLRARVLCLRARKALKKATYSNNPQKFIFLALSHYQKALENCNQIIEPYLALAQLCLQFNKKKEAFAILQNALNIEPEHPQLKIMLAGINLAKEPVMKQISLKSDDIDVNKFSFEMEETDKEQT